MVPDLGHSVVSCEDENGFLVPIELRNEILRSFHDVIYDFDVVHVFLADDMSSEGWVGRKEDGEALTRECGRYE